MKRLISISLLLSFLFNVGGYYFGYLALRYRARVELIRHLDKGDYSEAQSVTFKIPLSVPYYPDSKDFERVNGAFEHNGEFYKLVKQRLEHDTLYIVCIKDSREKTLFTIMTDFARLSTDSPIAQKTLKLMSSVIKEYVSALAFFSLVRADGAFVIHFISQRFELLDNEVKVLAPPPDGNT